MNELAYKFGLRLQQYRYVRQAIDERADLREFRGKPTARILLGVLAICLSFAMCWPVISMLGTLSLYLHRPLLVVLLGPIIWGLTHCLFLFGMALSGEKYLRILLRCFTRICVEKLLSMSPQTADNAA